MHAKRHPRTPLCTPACNTQLHADADAANLSGAATFEREERRREERSRDQTSPPLSTCCRLLWFAVSDSSPRTSERDRAASSEVLRPLLPPPSAASLRIHSSFLSPTRKASFMCARARLSVCATTTLLSKSDSTSKKKKTTGLKLLSSLCLHPQSIICVAQRFRKSHSNRESLSRNNVCVTLTQPCEPQLNHTRDGGNMHSPLHLKEKGVNHKSR